ncbi:hypothetical protein [Prauserella flavalba]|uniref:Uncharacterized protein n=1 Tax=Prauserella flavalba TaxID=1477506 RepID=A0A318LWM2_9PSEU|nr:hypothetical protein [Prauserella flavalba]PXY36698.1 hypothetical protein BA062_15180 [Prauserella flavalba]
MTTDLSAHVTNDDVLRTRRHSYHTKARAYDHGASVINGTHRILTVVTASLSALVSSAIFTSLNVGEVGSVWKWIAAGVSLAATILAAAVAALGHSDTASEYRKAAVVCVQFQSAEPRSWWPGAPSRTPRS